MFVLFKHAYNFMLTHAATCLMAFIQVIAETAVKVRLCDCDRSNEVTHHDIKIFKRFQQDVFDT